MFRTLPTLFVTAGLAFGLAAPLAQAQTGAQAPAQQTQDQQAQPQGGHGTATATFTGLDGTEAGQARLTDTPSGLLIELEVAGLPASAWVSFHIHETGTCDPADAFESAGGHFNPNDTPHGILTEEGPHAGDMPNQHVGADGVLRAQVFNVFVALDDGEADVRGRSLLIHDGEDDHMTQPSGDAGDRIACAVIE